jgi:surfactin synthase thioesterase subunit
MTMAELAGEHADALRDAFAAPVDLVGTSIGSSIAATALVQRFNSAEIQVAYLALRDCGRADCRGRPAQA